MRERGREIFGTDPAQGRIFVHKNSVCVIQPKRNGRQSMSDLCRTKQDNANAYIDKTKNTPKERSQQTRKHYINNSK